MAKYRTLELFVVEKVLPSLDASERVRQRDNKLYDVTAENGETTTFRLVKDLAGGASARIYKGYSRNKNGLRPIAIKRIDAEEFRGFEEEFQALLDRELQALQELKPFKIFVTEFYGSYYYQPRDEHWLAMEFCDGASIFQLAPYIYGTKEERKRFGKVFPKLDRLSFNRRDERRRSKVRNRSRLFNPNTDFTKTFGSEKEEEKTINFKQVAAIAAGALRGLDVIHRAGFIHHDVKSGNILLCYPGIVKICDFGLTIKTKGAPEPSPPPGKDIYHALGTLDYMAPEVMLKSLALDHGRANPHRYLYDKKSDIWALGIIILEILLGHTPLSQLRRESEDEFSFFLANMCKSRLPQNKGSALGFFFYLNNYLNDFMRGRWQIKEIDLLCKRVPELNRERKDLLRLLVRPQMYNKPPNPRLEVQRIGRGKLFTINKCLDFIAQCLYIKYKWRPDAAALLQHPFVKTQGKELQRLDNKLEDIKAAQKKWGERKNMWRRYAASTTMEEIYKILEKHRMKLKKDEFEVDINVA